MTDPHWTRGKDGRISRKSPKRGYRSSRKGPCKICEKILSAYRNVSRAYDEGETLFQESHTSVMIESDCVHHKNFITQSLGLDDGLCEYLLRYGGRTVSLRVVHDPRAAQTHGLIQLNASWIQKGLPRKWKEYCDRCHTELCSSPFASISAVRPAWLVDAWLSCLVPFSGHESYVALSYVWGGVHQYKTISSDLKVLQRVRSLSPRGGAIALPATISDAMGWVQALGERFLWVDSLCVISDELKDKHSELDRMAGIYANASVTIVAAQGSDASYGLRGLRGVSKRRSLQRGVYSLRKVQLGERSFSQYNCAENIWQTRGWTFQESLFSRRRLIFEMDCVRWECGEAQFLEEDKCIFWSTPELKPHQMVASSSQYLLRASYPDVSRFARLVNSYNQKRLTYREDILRAFSGTAYALSSAFPGGFVSGLPAGFFSVALLWRGAPSLSRRKATTLGAQLRMPSWSWAGWKGSLVGPCWAAAEGWMKYSSRPNHPGYFDQIDEVIPLCQWKYKLRRSDIGVQIHDVWQEYRSKHMEGTHSCPRGWTKHRRSESNDDSDTGWDDPTTRNRKWLYKHESEPVCQFWFPLPIGPEGVASPMIDAPFISCHTRRTSLSMSVSISETITGPIGSRELPILRSVNGSWIGVLHPDGGTKDAVLGPYAGQTIQLVEMALGKRWFRDEQDRYSRIYEIDVDFRPKSGDPYEFYHVMWVEMVDGIAYRKGLGEVHKTAWEAQDREDVDLTLG